ncbi:MAG: hypothetical protein ABIG30_01195 [Candidatus Aenigmatarchaeota archaeon]
MNKTMNVGATQLTLAEDEERCRVCDVIIKRKAAVVLKNYGGAGDIYFCSADHSKWYKVSSD